MLRTLTLEGRELDIFGILNDRTADGRDVSWVWDADWEVLAPHVRRMTCSGTRAAELALRMKYAGVDTARLRVVEGVPADKMDYKPHPNSPSAQQLVWTMTSELRRAVDAVRHRGDVVSRPIPRRTSPP